MIIYPHDKSCACCSLLKQPDFPGSGPAPSEFNKQIFPPDCRSRS